MHIYIPEGNRSRWQTWLGDVRAFLGTDTQAVDLVKTKIATSGTINSADIFVVENVAARFTGDLHDRGEALAKSARRFGNAKAATARTEQKILFSAIFGSKKASPTDDHVIIQGKKYGKKEIRNIVLQVVNGEDLELSLNLLADNMTILAGKGFFTKDELTLIIEKILETADGRSSAFKREVVSGAFGRKFLPKVLPILIRLKIFEFEEFTILLKAAKSSDMAAQSNTLNIIAQNFEYFLTEGWLTYNDYHELVSRSHTGQESERAEIVNFISRVYPTLKKLHAFSTSDYDALVSNLKDEIAVGEVLLFLSSNFGDFIKAGYFDIIRDYPLISARLDESSPHVFEAISFLTVNLEHFIKAQVFTQEQYNTIANLLTSDEDVMFSGIRSIGLNFIKENLGILTAAKMVRPGDFKAIKDNLKYGSDFETDAEEFMSAREARETAISVYSEHLGIFLERGLFGQEEVEAILWNSENRDMYYEESHPGADHVFWEQHLGRLVKDGIVDETIITRVALALPDAFLVNFHGLRESGHVTEIFLKRVLERCDIPAYTREVIATTLGQSAEWLASHQRWKQFLKVMANGENRRAILEHTIGAKPKDGDTAPISIGDLSSLFSYLASASDNELEGLMTDIPIPREGSHKTRTDEITGWKMKAEGARKALEDAASHLGITQDKRFIDAMEKINGENGEYILVGWALDETDKVWKKYLETEDVGKKKRNKGDIKLKGTRPHDFPEEVISKQQARNKLLNFLEKVASNKTSRARLIVKHGRQIAELNFLTSITSTATPAEAAAIRQAVRRPPWTRLRATALFGLLVKSAGFMDENGKRAIRRLVTGLTLENGRLVYPRYAELTGIIEEGILKKWIKEYTENQGKVDGVVSAAEREAQIKKGQEAIKRQTIDNIRDHVGEIGPGEKEKLPENLKGLPEKVAKWLAEYESSGELDGRFIKEAVELRAIFESEYNLIRRNFGDVFAGIRTDLKNFVTGMQKGVRVAKKSEEFEVTGDPEKIAKSGSEPVLTCQNLESAWVNERGQPIHRMLHGQFKVANWKMDGVVVARRLIEITIDKEGNEHLLVERIYTMGGFANIEEFDGALERYAAKIGIKVNRVHFADRRIMERGDPPPPVDSGDEVYRDTFRRQGMSLKEGKELKASLKPPAPKGRRVRNNGARPKASKSSVRDVPKTSARNTSVVSAEAEVAKHGGDILRTSREIAFEALQERDEKVRMRKLTVSYVLGFGRAGLEFLMADLGKSLMAGDMATLHETISNMGDLGKTHAWMYFGGAATNANVETVMKICPALSRGFPKSIITNLIKPWLGLVIGSALNEYSNTGRIDWGQQANTAIAFKAAGIAMLPLRMIISEIGLASGPIGILTAAAFLGAEMAIVASVGKALDERRIGELVASRANRHDDLHADPSAKKADVIASARELSDAMIQYAISEGLNQDLTILDLAYAEGGKAATLSFDGANSRRLKLIEELKAQTDRMKSWEADISGGETLDAHNAKVKKIEAGILRLTYEYHAGELGKYIEGLETAKTELKNRHADMSISQLKYEIEMLEIEKWIAFAQYELKTLEIAANTKERDMAALEVITAFSMDALEVEWKEKEQAILKKLFAIHGDWLNKYASREKLISRSGNAHVTGYAAVKDIVDASMPQSMALTDNDETKPSPEKIFLLGKYIAWKDEQRKEEPQTPSPYDVPVGPMFDGAELVAGLL